MNEAQWINSFKKYDESTGWDKPKRRLEGGIVEHSRAFEQEVSLRPDKFYDFVDRLGSMADVSKIYLASGISGLLKAKHEVEKIRSLVKKYWKINDNALRRTILDCIEYIDNEEALELEELKILEEYILHDPDPTKDEWLESTEDGEKYYGGDPIHFGINTIRGTAARRLAIHGYKTNHPQEVFQIMENISKDHSVAVKCCLIEPLAGMLRWDRAKTYDIFVQIMEEKHPQIIKYGLSCLSYLMSQENFEKFIPYLEIAMDIDEQYGHHHFGEHVGDVLTIAYFRGYPKSKELLAAGFAKSDKIKSGAIQVASKYLKLTDNSQMH